MIQVEIIKINDKEYQRTYSDENRYVVRDGVSYSEAIDPVDSGRTYTEGDLIDGPIENSEETTEQDYLEALAELGVNTNEEV